jgi:tight adherence protein B
MLIAIGCFIGILGLFMVLYWSFVLRPETHADRALSRRLGTKPTVSKLVRTSLVNVVAPASSLAALERLLAQFAGRLRPLEQLIERAGYSTSLGTFVLASVFAAGIGALAAMQLVGDPIAVVGAAVLFGSAPLLFFKRAAKRRVAKFEEQFPEAIDLIARALRAGHAFTTGLGMVADEVAEPARSEFRLVHDRQNYGMPLQDALKGLAERVQLLDARFFVTAVLTQRESGGNLSEVLDSLSKLIRERFRLKRQVRVLSAHGRITGSILAALPIVLSVVMFLIAPQHMRLLFTDPLGRRMIAVAAVLQVVGFLAMRRIADIEI